VSENLAKLVLSFVEEEFVVDRADIVRETRSNMMCFGFDPAALDPKVVESALLAVGEQLRRRLTSISWPVTFYAWYDEQAGQLRCSVASVAPDALPFGGHYFAVEGPGPVLELMAADATPGLVAWEDLEDHPEESGDPGDEAGYSFPVFVMRVAE